MATRRNKPMNCRYAEPPIGIEPMTYALRGARSLALMPLPAQIAPRMAAMAPIALGFCGIPFHDPFHGSAIGHGWPPTD
jgi:hypothetical protein